ncbi:MAG TPA: O-antigen ligase family protein [Terriglobia bacterium]|nr:O-antigen ligase family protein [Terriglobia bacterium]
MISLIATAVCAGVILFLFVLQREPEIRTSKALWIPTVWMLISASRPLSAWLQSEPLIPTASQYVEGSPLERLVLSVLMAAALIVLLSRLQRVIRILVANWPIILYFSYCAVSILWSDFPGVALKRWVRASGDLMMILIVLTDRETLMALKRLFARVGFLLIPLSILLIEFYPGIGRMYSIEDMSTAITGVTTNKNTLGALCLMIGLASVWRVVGLLRERSHVGRHFIAHGSIVVMAIWLLFMSDSSTSKACFLLGLAVIVVLNFGGRQQATKAHFVVGVIACMALFIFVLPDAFASVVHALGRSTTLTGRTRLWGIVLNMNTDPWIGTGFKSFWLGSRLEQVWSQVYFFPQQAHNGYLETYINLGWIGVAFLGLLLATGYRNVISAFRRDPAVGAFQLTFFVVVLAYNITEAAFTMSDPLWLFLLLMIAFPPSICARDSQKEIEVVDPEELQEHQRSGRVYGYEEIA